MFIDKSITLIPAFGDRFRLFYVVEAKDFNFIYVLITLIQLYLVYTPVVLNASLWQPPFKLRYQGNPVLNCNAMATARFVALPWQLNVQLRYHGNLQVNGVTKASPR